MENESEINMCGTIFNLVMYAGFAYVFMDLLVHNTEPIRENDPNNQNTKFEKMLITIKEYILNNFCKKQKKKIKVNRKLKLDIDTKNDSESEHVSEHESNHESNSESKQETVRKSRRLQNLKPEYKGF